MPEKKAFLSSRAISRGPQTLLRGGPSQNPKASSEAEDRKGYPLTMDARTKKLVSADKKYLWHPFTQMRDWLDDPEPLVIEKGRGAELIDTEGRHYLDGVSSLWANVHGHRKTELDQAIKAQLGKVAHSTLLGLANIPATELAEELIKVAPRGLSKVFYSDSGSSAMEIALKMAFQYWQNKGDRFKSKQKFITLSGAYHGDTLGSVSLGGIDLFHQIYQPLLFKTFQIEGPYCYRCPLNKTFPSCKMACLSAMEDTLKKHHRQIAAVVIEPLMQGAAGMISAPKGYLKEVRRLSKKYGVLMIADEVATGFGRTGILFACEQEGVSPDLMALAKGITGGYLPLAATLATEEVYKGFLFPYKAMKTFFHGHTYTGNPLACAAALANLKIFKKERTLQKLKPKIEFLRKELGTFKDLPHVGNVRQQGFMVGIELVKDKKTKKPYPAEAKVGIRVCRLARDQGVILRPLGNVIVLMPALSLSLNQLGRLLSATKLSIQEITSNEKSLP
jgi:adenosylmethionine-8-amino-7-oxononanoate aminotransferase